MSTVASPKRVAAVLTLWMVCVVIVCAQTPTGKANSNELAQSLPFDLARQVTAVVERVNPPALLSIGSAVWVGKEGYLATCYHVVKGVPENELRVGVFLDPFINEKQDIIISRASYLDKVSVVAFDSEADVAILKSSRPPDQLVPGGTGVFGVASDVGRPLFPTGAQLEPELPKQGQFLLLAGYPLDQGLLVMQTGIDTGLSFINSGNLSSSDLRIMLSLVSNPGNSGGPVLNGQGKVVGLLEGNVPSPVKAADIRGEYPLGCLKARLDATGNPMRDTNGQVLFDAVQCMQNSGISLAIPSKFVLALAKKQNIILR